MKAFGSISNGLQMKKHPSSETEQCKLENTKPNFWQILLSTFAAAFGVQNRKNLEKDFKHGSIKVYIIAGILFTATFVFVVIFTVKIVLKQNGL